MPRALADIVVGLAGLVVLQVLLLIVIRMAALRRARRARRFRPVAEMALGSYLADSGDEVVIAGRGERALFLAIAKDALTDLRGDDRDRLVDLLVRLGFVHDAMLGLRARRTVARRRAAETLAALATPLAVPALRDALADRDSLVRTTCACTLAATGGEDVVPAVVAVACRDAPAESGAAASVMLALAQHRPEALAPLLAADSPAATRRIAIIIAADLRLSQLTGLLQPCLEDTDDLAASSARGLGKIGEFRAVPALVRLAEDADRSLPARAAAATALGDIGDPSSMGALEGLLAAPDWPLQAAAAEALARLGRPGSAVLRRAAASGRQDMAALAEAALDQ